jgi:ABC-type nitrate/sulfonate/bicarbonate transport system substrate-binding protein
MPNRRRAITQLAAGAAVAVAGSLPARAQTATLRVAYIPFEASAPLFYAQELGLWAKAGLTIELQPTPFGAAIAGAVASNAVDVGYATVMTIAAAHAKNIPFTIIAPANAYSAALPAAGFLVSTKAISAKSGKDLNGKTIGTPGLNTLGEYGVRAWVDATGGDSSTLHFVEIPFSDMAGAIGTGRIDAAYVAPPFLDDALKAGYAVSPEFNVIAKQFLVAGWFTTIDWAKGHPETVKRFAQTIRAAVEWADKNPAACVDVLVKYLKVDRAAIQSTARTYNALALTTALVQPGIDLTAHYAKFASFPAQDLIFTQG